MSRIVRSVLVLCLLLGVLGTVSAEPAAAASHKFLTLPFHGPGSKVIQQGFYWTGCCHAAYHGGIDYIKGTRDRSATWKSFPVYAAADGMACSQLASTQKGCMPGVGNRVLIKHKVAGAVFYTYYGHLKWIVSRIPRGGAKVHVRRGDLLGYAGHSGDPCCVIHLHLQLLDGAWKTIDPYGIYGTRSQYPDPAGLNGKHVGRPSYWLSDPPRTHVTATAARFESPVLALTEPLSPFHRRRVTSRRVRRQRSLRPSGSAAARPTLARTPAATGGPGTGARSAASQGRRAR